MKTALYRCLACHAEVASPHAPPPQWHADQSQVPRLLCPYCGCACAPEGWRLVAFEWAERHAHQGAHIEALAHARWSGCPNSLECQSEGQYAGDCERAQCVMPKCLAAIHSRLERAERRLDALASPPPGRLRARPAG